MLLAVFNLASACGRIGFGILADYVGPTNSLTLSMLVSAMSMLAIWPVSSSLTPFCIFIIINGLGQGGFFSSIPSVVGHIYGPTRVPVALAMTVTAWAAGYMLVSVLALPNRVCMLRCCKGSADSWIYSSVIWRK